MHTPRNIWKTIIRPDAKYGEVFSIRIPVRQGAKVISTALQNNAVCVWFEVNPAEPPAEMLLHVVGTGFGNVPENARFIGTVIEGEFVWHIYAAN